MSRVCGGREEVCRHLGRQEGDRMSGLERGEVSGPHDQEFGLDFVSQSHRRAVQD